MDDEFGEDVDFTAVANALDRPSAASSSSDKPKVQQPKPQALPSRSGPSSIIVSTRQKGNPSLSYIRNIPWEYGDIAADYVLGATTCALFLSLKYHRLHPEYVYSRIRSLGHKFNLRVLLTMVDIPNHEESLKELSKTSLVHNLTLILCWSAPEAGRYLELYKSYEHASPTSIRAHQATSYSDKLVDFVTVPRSVNKTDAVSLVSAFGTIRAAVNARPEEIGEIAGWGEKKVQRWYGTVREPFRVRRAAKRRVGLERDESTSSMLREDSSTDPARRPSLLNEAQDWPHEGSTARSSISTPVQDATSVGTTSSRKATGSRPNLTAEEARSPRKRAADEASAYYPHEDEEALLALAENNGDTGMAGNAAPNNSSLRSPAKAQEPLRDGVAAALAKLRRQ